LACASADSKWDRIELSDDEDNFHPNIDNNLMIRLQREKRQQREAEDEEKRKKLLAEGTDAAKAELDRMERTKKLNVGNICTDKFVSTHQKSNASESANPTTKKDTKLQVAASNQETFVEGYEEFLQEHRPLLLEYAAIDEQDEVSEQFILTNTQLLSEHATGFCEPRHWNSPRLAPASPPPLLSALPSLGAADLLHCINLQVEGKTRQMKKTARQYLLLTYVCDLAKSMPGRDARDAIRPLFRKMATSDESREAFNDHLAKYIAHVKTRAEVKKKEMEEEEEEGEGESEYVALKKGEQVGPGGLDPAEVFETLPKELQEAFGERSIEALKQCLSKMSTEDATYHMKRCTDSGLWNPAGGDDDDGEAPGESPPPPPTPPRPPRPRPRPALPLRHTPFVRDRCGAAIGPIFHPCPVAEPSGPSAEVDDD